MLSFFNQFSFFYVLNIITNISLPILVIFSLMIILNTKKMYLNSSIFFVRNFISNKIFSNEVVQFGLKNTNLKKIYISEVINNERKNYILDDRISVNNNIHGYYTFINSLFLMVLFINVVGIFPYFFSITTHVSITIGMSLTIVTYCLLNSIMFHFDHFLSSFTPQNSPLALAPLLSLIETISFFARIISLGVRLAANICAGHLLISIISMFGYACTLTQYWFILAWIPSILLIFVILLEICVSFIQSYIFIVLTIIYIEESFNVNSNHIIIGVESVLKQGFNRIMNVDKVI